MTNQNENFQPNYYAIIPANVRYCKSLCANSKLLYAEITSLTHKEGYCWASNKYFSDLYSVDERTVKRWIKNLSDEGFIFVETEKTGLSWDRKIWIKENFTKGQKCPDRRDKNVPIEGTKMSPYQEREYNIKKEQQQNTEPVAVFSEKLKKLDIPLEDKIWISKTYTDEIIDHAIDWACHPLTKIETTLQQALKWACRALPEIPKDPQKQIDENRDFVMRLECNLESHPTCRLEILSKTAEIIYLNSMKSPEIFLYSDTTFQQQIKNALLKAGFKLNKPATQSPDFSHGVKEIDSNT